MAAWIPKTVVRAAKNQNAYVACQAIQTRGCTNKPRIIKNPTTANLKRGTGGRSSFSGVVCTVFGANGFIGQSVVNRLGKIGTQIIIPHRSDTYDVLPLKLCGDLGQILFHPFNLRDEDSIIKSIKYSNVVINLIGSHHATGNFSLHDVNVQGARTIARLAKQCGVEHFIHVSCLNADPNPKPLMLPDGSQILKSKWEGECAVREEFPSATIVRPASVYGQGDNFIQHYMHSMRRVYKSIPLWEKGEKSEKQPVHISDVAAGITAIATNIRTAGQTYQFIGPKRYTLHEIVKWFYDLATQGEEDPFYAIHPIKHHYLFQMKVTLNEILQNFYPISSLSWEMLEKEHVSDKVLPGVPTLEDLGITPTHMESKVPWEIKPYKFVNKYQQTLGEFVMPPPPKEVPIR
ncbi:NADH:ubiquinone oxidoreductase subunit 39 [Halictus rubicundus]|uniref:NADH:ubiquinone oxidoreductase subunit 39 n=1 Tax=Halictus rubicundus TaxID=77578 RepID=UPI004035FC59